MQQWLMDYQVWCRLGFFVVIFALFATWESLHSWRPWLVSRKQRWAKHLSLAFIGKVIVKLFFPLLGLGFAFEIQKRGMGLLNQTTLPYPLIILLSILGLDFVLYLQHRVLHKFKWLWRLHRVHHMDKTLDISTAVRFHPLEELVTMIAKTIGIAMLGIPVLAVFIYELLLKTALLFAHVNVRLPPKIDKKLRVVLVTPGMHRIHHSDTPKETNSNFGFCFSIWDKLLGTYVSAALTTERKLVIGLEEYQNPKYQTLQNMLLVPFNFKFLKVWPKKPQKIKLNVTDESLPHGYFEGESDENNRHST
ncbi:MAG: sterol desaturase family protein [Candidatus Berkiellales bacterium]